MSNSSLLYAYQIQHYDITYSVGAFRLDGNLNVWVHIELCLDKEVSLLSSLGISLQFIFIGSHSLFHWSLIFL
jgi:hypothetical protein